MLTSVLTPSLEDVWCDGWPAHGSCTTEQLWRHYYYYIRLFGGTSDAGRGWHPAPSCPQLPEDPHRRRILMIPMCLRHTADSQCRRLEPPTCPGWAAGQGRKGVFVDAVDVDPVSAVATARRYVMYTDILWRIIHVRIEKSTAERRQSHCLRFNSIAGYRPISQWTNKNNAIYKKMGAYRIMLRIG